MRIPSGNWLAEGAEFHGISVFAGAARIELTQEVLETPVLPLYDAPMGDIKPDPEKKINPAGLGRGRKFQSQNYSFGASTGKTGASVRGAKTTKYNKVNNTTALTNDKGKANHINTEFKINGKVMANRAT